MAGRSYCHYYACGARTAPGETDPRFHRGRAAAWLLAWAGVGREVLGKGQGRQCLVMGEREECVVVFIVVFCHGIFWQVVAHHWNTICNSIVRCIL